MRFRDLHGSKESTHRLLPTDFGTPIQSCDRSIPRFLLTASLRRTTLADSWLIVIIGKARSGPRMTTVSAQGTGPGIPCEGPRTSRCHRSPDRNRRAGDLSDFLQGRRKARQDPPSKLATDYRCSLTSISAAPHLLLTWHDAAPGNEGTNSATQQASVTASGTATDSEGRCSAACSDQIPAPEPGANRPRGGGRQQGG